MAEKLPLLDDEIPYNPLDKENLATSIAEVLLRREVLPLDLQVRFRGAGVYALYYVGDFPAYGPVSQLNQDHHFRYPIYVGKAEPTGRRTGKSRDHASRSTPILNRLRKHATGIKEAKSLRIEDFFCRYLVIDVAFITLEERLLIEKYQPVWNAVSGFGINVPGEGRKGQKRSEWDTLHPGRSVANGLPPNKKTRKEILDAVEAHLGQIRDPMT